MANPNWDDLRVFLAVAREERLSAAGKTLRMDPATVSRRIARLEASLSTPLFTRSPQGYALNGQGAALLERAQAAEQAMRGIGEMTRSETLSGQIRLGAPDGCANYLLPQICEAICADHPGLEVQIVALPRVVNLSKREADMAVTVSPPKAGRLTVQKLADYQLHLAASAAYLSRHGRPATLEDLRDHKVIGYIADLIFDPELDYLSEIGAPSVDFASNSVSVQINWARVGAGMVIAHDFALPSAPELQIVLRQAFALKRSFYLVRHADDRDIARLSQFAEALAARMPAEIARLEGLT